MTLPDRALQSRTVSEVSRIPVQDIARYNRVWLLDTQGGGAVEAKDGQLCHGLGCPYPRPFSAVYVHDGRLWLQIGRERWDVASIAKVDQLRETARVAEYLIHFGDGSTEPVRIRFPASVAAFRVVDPTHDEIESWSEDVMKLLPYTAADGRTAGISVQEWAAQVLPLWSSGLARGTGES